MSQVSYSQVSFKNKCNKLKFLLLHISPVRSLIYLCPLFAQLHDPLYNPKKICSQTNRGEGESVSGESEISLCSSFLLGCFLLQCFSLNCRQLPLLVMSLSIHTENNILLPY